MEYLFISGPPLLFDFKLLCTLPSNSIHRMFFCPLRGIFFLSYSPLHQGKRAESCLDVLSVWTSGPLPTNSGVFLLAVITPNDKLCLMSWRVCELSHGSSSVVLLIFSAS